MKKVILILLALAIASVLGFKLIEMYKSKPKAERFAVDKKKSIPYLPDPLYYLQPLGDFNPKHMNEVKKTITGFYGYEVTVLPVAPASEDLLAKSGKRYDASKILKKFNEKNKRQIILTEVDIVTKARGVEEWGILGLGYLNQTTCVISTKKLRHNNPGEQKFLERLKKVSLHEIGHNLKMDQCKNDVLKCLMKDANNSISRVDSGNYFLCDNCLSRIKEPFPNQLKRKKS